METEFGQAETEFGDDNAWSAAVTAGFKWLAIRAGWKETSALGAVC
jgi:hypothetical protein